MDLVPVTSGVPIGSETVNGIVEIATLAQMNANTKFGSAGGRLVVPADLYLTGAGLTSLNGQTGNSQTFAVGTAGVDFAINSLTNVHTFNLPSASASNRGALTAIDWSTFNNKVSFPVGTGIMAQTGASTITNRTLTGTTSRVVITSGDGVAGNPTFDVGANVIVSTSSYSDPSWITALAGSKISGNISGNAANVTGVVAIANGGTNSSTPLTNHQLIVSSGGQIVELGAALNGQIPIGSTGNTPIFAVPTGGNGITIGTGAGTLSITPTYGTILNTITQGNDTRLAPAPTAAGKILYDTGSAYAETAAGTTSQVLHGGVGAPTWSAVALATEVSGTLPIANGGTGQTAKTAAFDALSPTTTKGDLVVYNGTNNVRQVIGTDGYLLAADSTQTTGLNWKTVQAASTSLFYGNGSDGALSISSGTTTLNTVGKSIYQYTSVSITGTGVLKGGANLQNIPTIILVSGDLTVTSSTSPAVDWSGLGGPGGAAGGSGAGGGAGTGGATNHIANAAPATQLSAGNGTGCGGGGGGGYGNAGGQSAATGTHPSQVGPGGASNPYISSFSLTRILADLFLAGGGAGGSGDAFVGPGSGGAGGNGGGFLLFLVGGNINITSTFSVAGAVGSAAPSNGGGGGGGGGGFFGLWYGGTVTANTATITVSGGGGGAAFSGNETNGATGGAGQSIIRGLTSTIGL